MWVAFGRIVVAFAVLLPVRAGTRARCAGVGKRWRVLLVYSVGRDLLPWPLIGFGEQRVSSGLAAILIAAVPLVIALMALRVDPEERAEGSAARRPGGRVRRRRRAARPRRRRAARRAARGARDPARGGRLRGRADDHQAPLRATSTRSARSPPRWASRRSVLRRARRVSRRPTAMPSTPDACSRSLVLGLVCSALGFLLFFALIHDGRPGPRHGDHVREPGRRRRARRDAAGRGARADRRRRPAADPRRLLALDRRPAAAAA